MNLRVRRDWPLYDDNVRNLWREGNSASQIAAFLGNGFTRNAVIGRITRLGLTRDPTGPRKWNRWKRPEVAPASSSTPSKPKAKKSPLGLGALDLDQLREVQEMLDTRAHSQPEIAARFGVAVHVIERVSSAMGQGRSYSSHRVIRDRALVEKINRRNREAPPALPTSIAEAFAEGYHGQTGRLALYDLKEESCRFPIDQASGPPRYCGLDAEKGGSWCPAHAARCCAGVVYRRKNAMPGHFRTPGFSG